MIVDNAGGHNLGDDELSKFEHAKIVFLDPNVTSHVQPMDQSIINSFKCHYKKSNMSRLVNQIDNEVGLKLCRDVKEAIYMIHKAWKNVKKKKQPLIVGESVVLSPCKTVPHK